MDEKDRISLKEFIEKQNILTTQLFEAKLLAIATATELARAGIEKRLDTMNEFRQALKDANSRFLTRDEYSIMHEKVIDDIKTLRECNAESRGKASQNSVIVAYIIAVVSLIAAIVMPLVIR
jgi:hypothetical protein